MMTVADFAREHAGHDVRLFCLEVVDVTYYASVEGGAIVTGWEVRDTYNVETRSTTIGCVTCGILDGPEVGSDEIVVRL